MLPVVAVKMPADLSGQKNGKLGPCSLTTAFMPGVGHVSMHTLTKRAWDALAIVSLTDWKIALTVTSVADAYRSYDQQHSVFLKRYRTPYNPLTCTLSDQRVFEGKTWYRLRNVAAVATPGMSNHGWGLAVDAAIKMPSSTKPMSITSVPAYWQWLQKNALSFGFSWESQSEPWHLRYYAGDSVPKRVLEVEAALKG